MSKDQKEPNLEQQQQLSQQQKDQQRGLDTEQSQPVFDPREEKASASNQKGAGQQQKSGATQQRIANSKGPASRCLFIQVSWPYTCSFH